MKQVPYLGPTSIRHHHTKFSRKGPLVPGICVINPLIMCVCWSSLLHLPLKILNCFCVLDKYKLSIMVGQPVCHMFNRITSVVVWK
jgi:hypothetical protein